VDVSVKGAKVYDKFQFERNGYFSVDPDSKPNQVKALPVHAVCMKSRLFGFNYYRHHPISLLMNDRSRFRPMQQKSVIKFYENPF
jgi:hypothetical protein